MSFYQGNQESQKLSSPRVSYMTAQSPRTPQTRPSRIMKNSLILHLPFRSYEIQVCQTRQNPPEQMGLFPETTPKHHWLKNARSDNRVVICFRLMLQNHRLHYSRQVTSLRNCDPSQFLMECSELLWPANTPAVLNPFPGGRKS